MYFSKVISIVLLVMIYRSEADDWNYGDDGPDVWSDDYPACAGHSQSPINIVTDNTVCRSFLPFNFSAAYSMRQNFTLINNGHGIAATVPGNDSLRYNITGGGLNGTFQFVNFHFHWGPNYKSGSEHQVDGQKYAGELHIVHMNPMTSQLAVLGMFVQATKGTTSTHTRRRKRADPVAQNSTTIDWQNYLTAASTLKRTNNSTTLTLRLTSLFTNDTTSFWRYTGSLTTPPCTEGVIWTVFKQPITISYDQFEELRDNILEENYREPQPLYDRKVYSNAQVQQYY